MAELTYREAVAAAIAQEMRRDESVVFLGEDIAKAGGVFKATVGLWEEFGDLRVRDTPISEQAILGAAMGAAMTGLKPIAEIMFSDFLAVCWDIVSNQIAKSRYMTGGQVDMPLVIRTANGGGARFGAQHSQSVENWAMMIPGIKVVAPSTPADVKGLLAAAIRDPDPVIFFEQKSLYAVKGEVLETEYVDEIGKAKDCDGLFSFTTGNAIISDDTTTSSDKIIEKRLTEMGILWKWRNFNKTSLKRISMTDNQRKFFIETIDLY